MLPRQRQESILKRIRQNGGVRVSDLVHEFAVSDMTIRRDLELLAERGLVEKVHGGATTVETRSTSEPGFEAKSKLQQAEKRAIAHSVRDLIGPGSIGISAGTTTHAVAQALVGVDDLTVVTNSIPVAEVFQAEGRSSQTVILTGGIRTPSDALVGPVAVQALQTLHVDVAVMGVHGIHPRSGFTTPNLLEGETDRALVESAQRLIVVADHTKWGVIGISTIARLEDADVLVTDHALPVEAQQTLKEAVGALVLAPVPQAITG